MEPMVNLISAPAWSEWGVVVVVGKLVWVRSVLNSFNPEFLGL